jgi:hypothetical protein
MPRWSPIVPRWRREYRALRDVLVAESGAFCLGRYADWLDEHSTEVPVWAWTNLLAHGTEEQLRLRATSPGGRDWERAQAYLATEILGSVECCSSLAELQHEVLVPLELELAARDEVRSWNPQCWVVAVRTALRAHRHSARP